MGILDAPFIAKDSAGRRIDSFSTPKQVQSIVFLGDSLTEQGGMIPAAPRIKGTSPWPWAMSLLGQRFTVLKNAGIGGQTTAQILSRFDSDVTALNPGWVHILAGTNDMGVSLASAKTNITAMLDKADRAGIRPILGTIPPRIGSSYTGTQKADTLELNRWIIATTRSRPNVILVDYFSALADPSANFRALIAGWNPTSDGIHLSSAGGYAAGLVLANILNEITTPSYPYTSVIGTGLNLVSNSDFSQGVATAVPQGWTSSGTGAASTTWSSVARSEFPGLPWKQAVIPNGVGASQIQANSTVGINGLVVGDTLNAYVEYDISNLDSAAANQAFYLAIKFWNGSSYTSNLSTLEDLASPNLARSGALFVPDVVVPIGTTIVTTELTMFSGGTYKIGRIGLYKANTFT